MKTCWMCEGTGKVEYQGDGKGNVMMGTTASGGGYREDAIWKADDKEIITETCPSCKGSGIDILSILFTK